MDGKPGRNGVPMLLKIDRGGGITSSGILTAVSAPDGTSGVSTPGTYEITNIRGSFADSNDGISGAIKGLYLPISYITPLIEPVAFTSAGLSYDDLFFPGGGTLPPTARVTHSPVAISTFWVWPSTWPAVM
jgi:hypothetical protein